MSRPFDTLLSNTFSHQPYWSDDKEIIW